MNILVNQLPGTVEIDGLAWPINTDFYVGVQFELMMQEMDLQPEEKLVQALDLYYPKIPSNFGAAVDRLLWFYGCGRREAGQPAKEDSDKNTRNIKKIIPKAYCFEQDSDLIFAAFYQTYSIDLNTVEGLHWWKFRALFQGLPAECEFCKIMGYRLMDTKGLPKKQKQHYDQLKQLHALKNQMNVASALTLAERNQRMKDYVARRFEEVEATDD